MTAFKITTLTAYVATEEDGTEGILSATMGNNMTVPLICADAARIESWRGVVKQTVKRTGLKVILAKFSIREDIEEIK